MASVSLVGVSKVFSGRIPAVKSLNLAVADEEFLVLLGPSGCGKSTTLRLIAGLEEATTGEIRIGDRVVNDVPPKDRNIAMVFQNYALYPHMTVYKNMAFGLELRYGGNWLQRLYRRLTNPAGGAQAAAKRRGIRDEVRQTAQALGIEHLLDRMPRQLSGGERQRVALGRAIVRHPAVFLFDEPLSNLDAKLRAETRRELGQLHRRLRTTMVYVTHDQTEALTLGDRIAVMESGEIRQIGTPLQVYDQPQSRFVAGFLGSPPMNFVSGRLLSSRGNVRFEAKGIEVSITKEKEKLLDTAVSGPVTLGVRPEDLVVQPCDAAGPNVGSVVLIERLGDLSLVHLEVGTDAQHPGVALVAKSEPRTPIEVGTSVKVHFAEQRIHVFDGPSGDNLTLERG